MVEDAIMQLEELLAEEREAIRRLDGTRVLELSQHKQALASRLTDARPSLTAAQAGRLAALVPALRRNAVLLAHARDVLRDGVSAMRIACSTLPAQTCGHPSPRVGTLSVRG